MLVLRFLILASFSTAAAEPVFSQRVPMDPARTVGVESCRDCHEEMVETWEESAHARSYDTLTDGESAARMAERLEMKPVEIPMKESCVRCHYTHEMIFSQPQPTEAVSCESCHGGATDWLNEHNDSTPRPARVAEAEDMGMVHPASIFSMAKTCYECHVVDDEQLVNRAGHPALSDGFEFLSWYSGEVKHNFLVPEPGEPTDSHTEEPQPIPQPRRRMLYLSGKLLHLAHTLRAMSLATDPPVDPEGDFIRLENGRYTFAVQHALEVRRLREDMRRVLERVTIPEYVDALAQLRGLELATGHQREMGEAAGEVMRLAERFCAEHAGEEFGAIDPILESLEPRYSEP